MIRVRNATGVVGEIEVGDRSVELVAATTSLTVGSQRFGLGVSYRRPARIETDGGAAPISVHDYVMIVRLVGVVLAVLALARRLSIWKTSDSRS